MSGPEKKGDDTLLIRKVSGAPERLDATIDIDDLKLDADTINEIVGILVVKFPPGSDMHDYITGFEELGPRNKRHIISRINIVVSIGMPKVTIESIRNNIFEIIRAYKKVMSDDETVTIDTEE